ncbi:CD209 antigen-like protein E isoform X2 [Betta splendens]|uniref:CD209 antigen-like protein E isoform X2 n=1 Tax=Betta splendens TaxID=158456 RepID=A0A8M1HLH9_BETSP|nr:CD209 antigen-like protein E isoform X2 [Betta splendens]
MSGRREGGAPAPGGTRYRLLAVSFGLLCVTQASLNVCLRLILYSELQASYNLLAVKHQRLQSECSSMSHEQQQLQHTVENTTRVANAVLARLREAELKIKTLTQMVLNPAFTDAGHAVKEADGGRHERALMESSETSCSTLMVKDDLLQTAAAAGCVYFSGSYYFTSPEQQSWMQSSTYCEQRNAALVVIGSHAEQELVSSFQRPAWIGLSAREDEGQWTWVDGTPLGTQYWMESQPNADSHVDEDCAEITTGDATRNWNGASCSQKKFCICERTLTSDLF